MYRIARIRCAGIGPADARFDRPGPDAAPFELCCLDADDQPADTLAWLENGGGKTVFLSLVFQVVRPDKAAQIGKDQKGRRGDIGDFVLPGDVGHVVVEWVADDTDRTLITGILVERRSGSISRNWYLLSGPAERISLDDLVFDDDGRRITPARYLESLEQLAAATAKDSRHGRVELSRTSVQRTWIDTLANHHLDPALLEYQVRMNRSEGGATDLFRFSSSEQFVQFFLDLTLDPDTVTALGETLSRVAQKVSALPQKELELAHATGAVEKLSGLSDGWAHYTTAEQASTAARQAAETLDDTLAAAVADAATRVDAAARAAEMAHAQQQDADRTRREADARSRALAIVSADAKIADLVAELSTRQRAAGQAQLTASAWPRVPLRLRMDQFNGQADVLRELLADADRQAEPLRDLRDLSLRALRSAIAERRDHANAQADEAEAAQSEAGDAEQTANEAVAVARAEAGQADGRLSELAKTVDAFEARLEEARAAGLVGDGQAPDQALAAAVGAAAAVEADAEAAASEQDRLTALLPGLLEGAEAADRSATQLGRDAESLDAAVGAATEERSQLAADPLLAELGAADSDLELVGGELAVRVAAEAVRARSDAVAAEAASAEDRRAVQSLEAEQLLPPRADVEALCRRLHAAGVSSASPGWRYLVETVPAPRHGEIIAAAPALVEGIVVAESDLIAARSALADAAPAAALTVATGAQLAGAAEAAGAAWVIIPDPAMHDRGTAETAIASRQERLDAAGIHQQALTEQERAARGLAERLSAHLEAWPPGLLPAQTVRRDEAAHQARIALTTAGRAAEAVVETRGLIEEHSRAAGDASKRLRQLERHVGELGRLAEQAAAATDARTQAEDWEQQRRTALAAAGAAQLEAAAARQRAADAAGRLRIAAAAGSAASRDLAQLPDPGPGPSGPSAPIEELRARYSETDKALAEATTESELARELKSVEADLSTCHRDLDSLSEDLRARVEELAAEPAAADESSRRQAEQQALSAASAAGQELSDTESEHKVAVTTRRSLPDPDRPVELDHLPTELDALERLAADAIEALEAARQARTEADEQLNRAREAAQAAELAKATVETHREALTTVIGARQPCLAEPFDGDPAAAVRQALGELTAADRAAVDADKRWQAAARDVNVFARDPRWAELSGDLPRRLLNDQPETLAAAAANLLTQTRILADRLKEDIAGLDTHRQLLVTSLADAVSSAQRNLRMARTRSVLPDGLGDWSGQPFLKVSLDVPADRAEMDARLRRFINDLLERSRESEIPAGAALVCRALLACAEREVTVQVLKPNKAQRLRYVPVHDMAELSGGMRATAAIAMFCTLIRVRAANRKGRAGVATLILDNPIGDANATYLVALQRLVAHMSDVQLLYTTGVNDMDAIRLFPVVTRLTNEAAKRSHLSYVVADEAFLKQLMPHDGDYSLVTGTRLVRRRPVQLTLDMGGSEDEEWTP